MTAPSQEFLQAFTQQLQNLVVVLRQRTMQGRVPGSRPSDPDEMRTCQLIEGQLQQVTGLGEEIVARLRGCKVQLLRAAEGMDREERRLQQALLTPVAELREALAAAYGGDRTA